MWGESQSTLEASESRYRRLFETAKDGILILNGDTGQVIDVNPFLTELTGHSHTYFLGKHLWEIGAFKDIAASKEAFTKLQAQTYVRYEDLPLECRDGSRTDVEFVSNVYRVGSETMIQCNIRDVATRRRAERRTQQELACLKAILESSGPPIFAIDSEYRYTAFNQAYAVEMKSIYGVDVQVGGPLVSCQRTRDVWRAAQKLLDRALRGEAVTECVDRGDDCHFRRYLENTYYPVRSPAGGAIGVAVFSRDVTERRLAEDEMRFRNLILSTQLDTSLDGIQVVDVLGRTISSNQRFADMWGIPSDVIESETEQHLLQRMIEKVVQPEEFERTRKQILKISFEETRSDIGLKDGRMFDCYSAPMVSAEGEHFGRVWQFRDITARKLEEKKREMLEEQLRTSQKLEAIGSLAGGIAHDFNNMLSVILSYTTFVKEGLPEDHSVMNDLLEVQKAAERAAALTKSLLAFGRKQVLQPVTLSLNLIVSGMETMLRSLLGESIEAHVVLAPNLGLTRADPNQIEQVLMNLVINARDAMPSGGKLTIETANATMVEGRTGPHLSVAPGSYVVLTVTDTGCGMDEQTKNMIFEPFFTTKDKGKGTGLGLSTAFGIVKQTGGHISVYSTPGQGTTFEVHLPLNTSGSIPAPCHPPKVPKRSTGTETILVVEDEVALRKVATRTLEAAGYSVITAASGEEALQTATQHVGDIHLLLTDVIMPGMNGKMLAKELKKTRPTLEIVYMSGYTDSVLGKSGVLDRGTHFLAKPFIAADLARKVRRVIDGVLKP
jgi:PAS domain S-box-containing protein